MTTESIDNLFAFQVGSWVRPKLRHDMQPVQVLSRRLEQADHGHGRCYCLRLYGEDVVSTTAWFGEIELEAAEAPTEFASADFHLTRAARLLDATNHHLDVRLVREIRDRLRSSAE